ncbi:MAG: hypothetical protein A4S14_08040 [Proteobacteria bacterium SG_bin9]|nr:MAG: hypothetical protein A4S14_08040 [Proteobacteria bacterium SG_bin9]
MRPGIILAIASLLAALAPTASARAEYPDRPITLIIPFAPGGSTSIVGRAIADKMTEILGQKLIVENRPGAGGTVGTKAVAGAEPDGYTIALGYTGTLAIGPTLYTKAGYDPRKDFAAIGAIGHAPNSIVVHPSFPAKTLGEFVTYAKANPEKVSFGSAGAGSASHITGEYFASIAGIKIVHIAYKGTGPAMADVLGGHIPMVIAPIPATHANASAGTLRALAVTSAKRTTQLPDVPTIAEAGYPNFEASLTYGLIAPAATPRSIVDKLNQALRTALASDDVRRRLMQDGTEPTPGTPEQYATFIDEDETRWSKVIKASGAKPE